MATRNYYVKDMIGTRVDLQFQYNGNIENISMKPAILNAVSSDLYLEITDEGVLQRVVGPNVANIFANVAAPLTLRANGIAVASQGQTLFKWKTNTNEVREYIIKTCNDWQENEDNTVYVAYYKNGQFQYNTGIADTNRQNAAFGMFLNPETGDIFNVLMSFDSAAAGAVTFTMNFMSIIRHQYNTIAVLGQDPYSTAPDSTPDGGYGDFDYSGDSILPPDLPTISAADSGFVTLYAPTLTQIQSLASYMWSGLFDIATFRKLFADPMDCIISLNIVPVDLPAGVAKELKVGNIGTGQSINVLGAQFIKISFATKNIGVRTNSFMDYSPYVKAQIFLPFIGTRSLSIDDIANADVTVEYHIDLFSGACTAYIICKKNNSDGSELKSALYEFSGNICANIPFTATNYNSFLSSLLGTAAAVTTAIATQGSSSAVAGALSSGIDTATAIKPDVERSGNMSATNGFLGIQKPFLIVTYPHVCKPACRDKTVGTPSFIGLSSDNKLSSFHKLTKLHRINAKGIPCTEQERRLIIDQLTGEGVIMP